MTRGFLLLLYHIYYNMIITDVKKMSNPNLKIRIANLADVQSIFDITRTTWLDTYPNEESGIRYEDIIARFSDCEKFFQKIRKRIEPHDNNNCGWVADLGGKIVGFSTAVREDSVREGDIREGDERVLIKAIYVRPEYQGQGIGGELLREMLDFYKNSKEFWLEVAIYNNRAIGFYEKFGFQIVPDSAGKHEIISDKFIPTIKMKKR